jgi:hypothetical protein
MRIIKTNVDDLVKEMFNIYSGAEWFINGVLCDGTPKKYPQVENDGITYIIRAHEVVVYANPAMINQRTIEKEFNKLLNEHALKLNDNAVCMQHDDDPFGNYNVAKPLRSTEIKTKFADIIEFAHKPSADKFDINHFCSVIFDVEDLLNLKHNDVVYRLDFENFVGCENIYPDKILVSSLGKPLGMYFSTVWSHISEYFGSSHPFQNTSRLISSGEYNKNMDANCFICTSKLHDSNYVLCDKVEDMHDKLPQSISVCPWCFHSYHRLDREHIISKYMQIKVIEYPITSAHLIDNILDYNLRLILKAINEHAVVKEHDKFIYVDAGEYIGISSKRTYIEKRLNKLDKFKNKKLFIIGYPHIVFTHRA